jgi:hypothetical protein
MTFLFFFQCTEGNVRDALMNLDEKKDPGPNEISQLFLRKIFLGVNDF